MMNYKIFIISLFIIFLILPICTIAVSPLDTAIKNLKSVAGDIGFSTTDEDSDIAVIVGRIIKAALSILGVIFLIITLYGGWLWMTAAGNEQRLDRAKSLLRDSIIGLIIVITAYAITTFVVASITAAVEPII